MMRSNELSVEQPSTRRRAVSDLTNIPKRKGKEKSEKPGIDLRSKRFSNELLRQSEVVPGKEKLEIIHDTEEVEPVRIKRDVVDMAELLFTNRWDYLFKSNGHQNKASKTATNNTLLKTALQGAKIYMRPANLLEHPLSIHPSTRQREHQIAPSRLPHFCPPDYGLMDCYTMVINFLPSRHRVTLLRHRGVSSLIELNGLKLTIHSVMPGYVIWPQNSIDPLQVKHYTRSATCTMGRDYRNHPPPSSAKLALQLCWMSVRSDIPSRAFSAYEFNKHLQFYKFNTSDELWINVASADSKYVDPRNLHNIMIVFTEKLHYAHGSNYNCAQAIIDLQRALKMPVDLKFVNDGGNKYLKEIHILLNARMECYTSARGWLMDNNTYSSSSEFTFEE